jgi:hypothetical protein
MDGYKLQPEENSGKKPKEIPGTGKICPMMMVVDSISAVLIERFSEQMLEVGSPNLTHPLQARLLSDFFKVGPKELVDYPITFVAVSHVKMSNDPRVPYIQVRNTTGGKAPKFQMTCEIDMQRVNPKKGQIVRTHPKYGEVYSIGLKMSTLKNSFGSHASIDVELTWYFDPDDRDRAGRPLQKTYFDWHTAGIELLVACSKGGKSGSKSEEPGDPAKVPGVSFSANRAKRLHSLVEIYGSDRRVCWSPVLGISEDSKVSYLEAGIILEEKLRQDPAFRGALYEVMGIQQRFLFQPGVDYDQQIAQHATLQRAESESRMQAYVNETPPSFVAVAGESQPATTIQSESTSTQEFTMTPESRFGLPSVPAGD